MALGGVATGSMKAKEALRVQGIITYRGFSFMDWDWERKHKGMIAPVPLLHRGLTCVCACVRTMEAKMGRKSVAVATLLAHSVKTVMRRQRMMAIAHGGMEWRGVI